MRTLPKLVLFLAVVSSPVTLLAQGTDITKQMEQAKAPATHPAVFTDKSFPDALAENKSSGKVLVVKATAEWCGPCKLMNRTTMVDDRVVKWFSPEGGNGTVIELDVDKDKKSAQQLSIGPIPTMIAFKSGQEVARTVGYLDAPNFLAWLDNAKAGKAGGAPGELTATVTKDKPAAPAASVKDRYAAAQALLRENKFDQATEEYAWLWTNMAKEDPTMAGVRGSFLVSDLRRLALAHAPARERFGQLRDEALSTASADPKALASLEDWATLNDALGENSRTLAWFDGVKADPSSAAARERIGNRLERVLAEAHRIRDIAAVYRDPQAVVRQDAQRLRDLPRLSNPDQDKMIRGLQQKALRERAGLLYASLLLAGRDGEAAAVANEAFNAEDSGAMRLALVKAAVEHGAARADQGVWLDQAEKSGEDVAALRSKLPAAPGK